MSVLSNILSLFSSVGTDVGSLFKRVTKLETNMSTFPNRRSIYNFTFALSNSCDPRYLCMRTSIGTYVDRRGAILTAGSNQARINHDMYTGQCLGLLLEPASTNFLPYSNIIVGTNTTLGSGTTASSVVGPDKITTANGTLVGNGTAANVVAQITPVSLSANTTYTMSLYARMDPGTAPSNGNMFDIQYNDGTTTQVAAVPFTGGSQLDGYWRRFSVTFTNVNAITANINLHNGTTSTSKVSYWGMQLEALPYKTSIIPTNGASITRLADAYRASTANKDLFYINALSGMLDTSIYISSVIDDFNLSAPTQLGGLQHSVNGANTSYLLFGSTGTNKNNVSHQALKYTSGSVTASSNSVTQIDPTQPFKEVMVLKNQNAYYTNSSNGGVVETLALGSSPLLFSITKSFYLYSNVPRHVRRLIVYNSALSNDEMLSML